ncbi:MAG: hypothetical protein IK048_01350 [Clostridia bacterium]|nr:hypothetical protein [Clostridia bacterium]
MKKSLIFILIFVLIFAAFSLAGCGLLDAITGNSSDGVEQLFDECNESTGKWFCYDYFTGEQTDAYFLFDGTKDVMHFEYFEGDVLKRDGVFRVVNRGVGKSVSVPLSIGFEIKGDSRRRDWIECYADDFKSDFTQFTIMDEYRDAGLSKSGTPLWHVYRLSEMPFKFGTYIKEGATLKEERRDYEYADRYYIPSGEYVHESGAKFTFVTTYYTSALLFRYQNGDNVVEGVYGLSGDKDIFFPYLNYHPGCGLTEEQARKYGNTLYFPPNYNVYGSFEVQTASAIRPSITLTRVETITGYDYDPSACEWQLGSYTFVG